MIFVTVGTHEQPFNRLIRAVDQLVKSNVIDEEVIVQTGYCDWLPKYCKHKKFFSYEQMKKNVEDARIVITHGGPSSFIMPLQVGKIPIVVPRKKQFGEHVNDHQLDFSFQVAKRKKNIIVIDEINDLGSAIQQYDKIISKMQKTSLNHNKEFVDKLERIINEMID